MSGMQLVRTLGRNDVRLILRDKMLATMLFLVFGMGLIGRWALPALDASLAESGILPSESNPLRFSDTYPLFVAFIGLWEAALMPGTVFGFLLLDEKEDETLVAMRVVPVSLESFLRYRITLAAGLAFVFALVVPYLIGLVSIPLWQHIPIALGASLVAPATTLLLAALAHDKVQGLAYTKFAGVAGLTILIGWFVPLPWQWLCGLFPPYLVAKAWWMALAGESLWWLSLLAGVAGELLLIQLLLSRFRRLAYG